MITAEELLDRAEIQDRLHRYCQAQDQNAWQLYQGVFRPGAEVEFVGLPFGTLTAEQLETFLRDFNATRLSGQHLIANTLIEVDGDTARSVCEVLHSTLQRTEEPGRLKLSEGGSLYADSWQRTAEGWQITHRVVTQKHLNEDVVDYDEQFVAVIEAGAAGDWLNLR